MTAYLLILAMTASEPQLPQEQPWPGGPWTGEGKDKGKYFPAGAFNYTKKADYEAYKKAYAKWEETYRPQILRREINKNPIKHDFLDLAKVLPKLDWKTKGDTLTATSPLSVYAELARLQSPSPPPAEKLLSPSRTLT